MGRTSIETENQGNSQRKKRHLRIALKHNIEQSHVSTGFNDYQFVHQALPEIDLADVDLSTSFLTKKLRAPLVISSMVGGIETAKRLNRNLARAAQSIGLAMGVGSQRCAIDDPSVISTYRIRDVAPDILLFANIGAVQLNYSYGVIECQRAVEMIGADALVIHLNPLQEALQLDGNTNFAGLSKNIERVCHDLSVPVIVKEVGFGISERVAQILAEVGVSAIDVAGTGGTSWSEIERHCAITQSQNDVAAAFASWGIPTADCIKMARRGAPSLPIIASGGIRSGLDIAKAIALGADIAGIAGPLIRAANISSKSVKAILQSFIEELRIATFCIGATSLTEIKNSPLLRKRGEALE